ncbi:MAG: rhodanese-like domain-containing protein [Epsilonproteobacteria bacterium]|nr:rhodanese-like domain-containing protein [Campylobacterota bacterium]
MAFIPLLSGDEMVVKITDDMPYVYTVDTGERIKVQRIQDTNNKLTDDYTKTSRPCPPFCIQPTEIARGVQNIEELELLKFMQKDVIEGKGIVVDARLKSWFELETIPSAINIPFTTFQNLSKDKAEKIFKLLGMGINSDGSWDFRGLKRLVIFDNGLWCEQAKHLIDSMLEHGFPNEKILYYRSGFQGWKLLGLTTVVHKEIRR